MSHCGALILAAGGSSRLGESKQLLAATVNGETLLARVVRTALSSQAEPVIVVLGAGAKACAKVLADTPVRIVENPEWREGIASSIRAGLTALGDEVSGVVILLCDQPMVSVALINELINCAQPIAVSAYGDTFGPPAFFSHRFFPELIALRGDHGAKEVVRAHPDEVATVGFPGGEFDIDTPLDRKRFVTSAAHFPREKEVL